MTRADKRKYHYIYKITRLDESGKYYIGMHSTDDLEDEYFGSGSYLSKSIKKHGKDKHKKEILEFLPTREALKLREKEIVNEELLGDKMCMNLKLGGEGGFDHLNNGSKAHLARCSKGGKLGGATSRDLGFSTMALKKNWDTNREHMTKVCSNTGKLTGPTNVKSMQTAKANVKRVETFKRIKHQFGEKNSQYGSCWVTKNAESVKIRKVLLDEYLKNGYSKGRKMPKAKIAEYH